MRDHYDVIVIGGGHAGTEAAWAAASALERWSGSPSRSSAGNTNGSGSENRSTRDRSTRKRPTSDGPRVALITMDPSRIGQMSCNPAIGGLAKGQMVREIDALGGIMGRAIDATGIMFKMLNTSKGAAVRGPRAQADKYAYAAEVQRLIASRAHLIDVIAGTVDDFIVEGRRIQSVILCEGAHLAAIDESAIEYNATNSSRARPVFHPLAASLDASDPRASRPEDGPARSLRASVPRCLRASSVVLTTGTFMRGLMHTGPRKTEGGRVDESAANHISTTLRRLGFELGRLKTGTPPRLARDSIDWDALLIQEGDAAPTPFSDLTLHLHSFPERGGDGPARSLCASVPSRLRAFPRLPQAHCRITRTTADIHDLIRANLDRAPMYSGQIEASSGPRYCPSIEDKVVRFADRESHHVFLEPESLHTNEIYCNGVSTSLPVDVQEQLVRMMPGCGRAEILRHGYAVEYDMIWPHQIDSTCMAKHIAGLFPAGQINCTTGYEEAGAQGLIAGLNAARFALGEDLVRIGREQAYIGVMLDDLVTKTPREPYRMFTSRAEYRLLLRADNSDARLTPLGRELGLVDDERWDVYEARREVLDAIRAAFERVRVEGKSLHELARRPEACAAQIASLLEGEHHIDLVERVMTESRYAGYIDRQRAEIRRQAEADRRPIPAWFRPAEHAPGLRGEAAEVLARFRPATMGQAARLPGVNPADLTLLAVVLKRGAEAGDHDVVHA